jgi:hypothetical protein
MSYKRSYKYLSLEKCKAKNAKVRQPLLYELCVAA